MVDTTHKYNIKGFIVIWVVSYRVDPTAMNTRGALNFTLPYCSLRNLLYVITKPVLFSPSQLACIAIKNPMLPIIALIVFSDFFAVFGSVVPVVFVKLFSRFKTT